MKRKPHKAVREGQAGRKRKAGTHWFSWLFGLALVAALVWVVAERSQNQELARLVVQAIPLRMLLGALFQIGTYLAEARILQVSLRHAHISSRWCGSWASYQAASAFLRRPP